VKRRSGQVISCGAVTLTADCAIKFCFEGTWDLWGCPAKCPAAAGLEPPRPVGKLKANPGSGGQGSFFPTTSTSKTNKFENVEASFAEELPEGNLPKNSKV
jgi:hypothetical protein